MPVTAKCELEGWEAVTVIYPADEEWTMRHVSRYEAGIDRAWQPFRESIKDNKGDSELAPTANEMMLFGVLAICEVDGLVVDLKTLTLPQLWILPPYYSGVFGWIASTVGGAYQRAKTAPKNS